MDSTIFKQLLESAIADSKVKNVEDLNRPRSNSLFSKVKDNIPELPEELWSYDERCNSEQAYHIFENYVKQWRDTTYLSTRNVMLIFHINKNTAKKVRRLWLEHKGLLKKKGRRPGEKKEFTIKSEALIRRMNKIEFKAARNCSKMIEQFDNASKLIGSCFFFKTNKEVI